MLDMSNLPAQDLSNFVGSERIAAVMADLPWRFTNRTARTAVEHKRLARFRTMTLADICALPVADCPPGINAGQGR